MTTSPIYDAANPATRTALLLGADGVERLAASRVIVFGAGGVGSWCIEALARAGVGHIAIVDSDIAAPSNLNRQLVALHSTVGQLKVNIAALRVHDINPAARVEAIASVYDARTAAQFALDSYDVIVDAIDSVAPKALLIVNGTRCRHARLVSSMGAALKTDLLQITQAPFERVKGDPLARALRDRFRRTGIGPARKFRCVYSPQLVRNKALPGHDSDTAQTANGLKRVNGTLVTTTASFGLHLAQLTLDTLLRPTK